MKTLVCINEIARCNVAQPPFNGLLDVSDGNPNTSFLSMAKNYCDVQLLFYSELKKHLQLTPIQVPITANPIVEAAEITPTGDEELIRGTRELAKFLRCGGNRANAIAKSGILKRAGIQFKMGNTNYYNKRKLSEALSTNPDLFKDLHWH